MSPDPEDEINMNDFLKEGGINLDEVDQQFEDDDKDQELERRMSEKRRKESQVHEILGKETYEGYLYKSSENATSEDALFSSILGTVTSTLKLVGDNIIRQR